MSKNNSKQQEIELDRLGDKALIQRSHLLPPDNKSEGIATHYREHKKDEIGELHRYARAFTNSPLLSLAKISSTSHEFRIVGLNPTYLALLNHLSINFKRIRDAYPLYEQSPIFKVFETVQRRFHGLNYGVYRVLMPEQKALYLLKKLEVAARCLHRRLHSPFVKKAYSNFRRNAQKTFKHLLAYLDSCFHARSNLLVVRVDLGFCLNDQQILSPNASDQDLDFEKIVLWRNLFASHLENIFQDGLIGRVFKIEHGSEKKFHLHCLILLDAAKHQQDVMIGKQLGEFWSETITHGLGGYFNVNGSNCRYLWPVLGKVNGTDPNVQVGMQLIAAYFTLGELFIKPTFAGNRRTLTTGCITESKSPPKSKRGKYKGGIASISTREAIDQIKFI